MTSRISTIGLLGAVMTVCSCMTPPVIRDDVEAVERQAPPASPAANTGDYIHAAERYSNPYSGYGYGSSWSPYGYGGRQW